MEFERQWDNLIKKVIEEIHTTFKNCPNCFFSEHDIHSSLYSIVKKELKELGIDLKCAR